MDRISHAALDPAAYSDLLKTLKGKGIDAADGLNLRELATIASQSNHDAGGVQFEYDGKTYTLSKNDIQKLGAFKGEVADKSITALFDAVTDMLKGPDAVRDVMAVSVENKSDRLQVKGMTFTTGTFAPGTLGSKTALAAKIEAFKTKDKTGLTLKDLDVDGKVDKRGNQISDKEAAWFLLEDQSLWGGDFEKFSADYDKAEKFVKSGFNDSRFEHKSIEGADGKIDPKDFKAYLDNARGQITPGIENAVTQEFRKTAAYTGAKNKTEALTNYKASPEFKAEVSKRVEAKITADYDLSSASARDGINVITQGAGEAKGGPNGTFYFQGYMNGIVQQAMPAIADANAKMKNAAKGMIKVPDGFEVTYEKIPVGERVVGQKVVGYTYTNKIDPKTWEANIQKALPPGWKSTYFVKSGDDIQAFSQANFKKMLDKFGPANPHGKTDFRTAIQNGFPGKLTQPEADELLNLMQNAKTTGKPGMSKDEIAKTDIGRMQTLLSKLDDKFTKVLVQNGGVDGLLGYKTMEACRMLDAAVETMEAPITEPIKETVYRTEPKVVPKYKETVETSDIELPVFLHQSDEDWGSSKGYWGTQRVQGGGGGGASGNRAI